MIKGILFDADNTLYNSRQTSLHADKAAITILTQDTHQSPDDIYASWRTLIESLITDPDPKKRRRRYSYALLAKQKKLSDRVDHAVEVFQSQVLSQLSLNKGVEKALPLLKNNYTLGIFTEEEKTFLQKKLETLGIGTYFSYVVTSDDTGAMKPNHAYYDVLWDHMGVTPSQTMVIGDSYHKDLALAKQAGAFTVLFGGSHDAADASIDDFNHLLPLLKKV